MASNSWKSGQSGDWLNGANWSSGSPPGAGDQVSIAAPGAYTVTLYGVGQCASLTLNDAGALLYDAGTLTVSGTTLLQAGTLALAYGSLGGGTLALAGGILACQGGTLAGETVQGTLDLSPAQSTLFVTGGLSFVGTGSVNLTGAYAALDFVGSQTFNNAVIALGNATQVASLGVMHAFGATSGATLTLGSGAWVRQTGGQGALSVGTVGGGTLADALVNRGTITVSGGTLTISGPGAFTNAGTIGISGGGTLDVLGGWANTGTVAVGGGTLDFGGTFASSLFQSLGAVSLSNGVLEIGGTCENAGATLTVGSGVGPGPITLAGTIAGGTISDSGGGLLLSPGTGVLDGATYLGTLALAGTAALTLTDGARLATAAGSGTATIGGGAALFLQGTEVLDQATVTLAGSGGGTAALGTADPLIASVATTATLGAHSVLVHGGGSAAIDANAQTPIPGVGLSDTLIADGTIVAGAAGGTLTIGGYGTFINAGTIAVRGGDTVLVSVANFGNTGTINVGAGSMVELGAPGDPYLPPAWSNTGAIVLAGGTLALGSTVSTTQLGQISGSGTVSLLGTLMNAGSTLSLGAGGVLPNLALSGTIVGGTIVDAGLLSAAGGAELDSVSYQGTLALRGAQSALRVRGGFSLAGQAVISGVGADLAFVGTETFDGARVQLGANGGTAAIDIVHDYSTTGSSWLTLGPKLSITQAGQNAAIGLGRQALAGDGITNQGTITAAVAGGTLALGGPNFINAGRISIGNGETLVLLANNFSNTGMIGISNASLTIADSLTLAALGALSLSNASIAVSGTLSAAGGTLTLGTGSAWGRLSLSGTIAGGTIVNTGGGLFAQGSATLSGVTFEGALDLSRPFQSLSVSNGITLTDLTGAQPGKIILTGPVTRLAMLGTNTLNNLTIYIGDASLTYNGRVVAPPALVAAPGSSLTLGPSAVVSCSAQYGTIGDAAYGQWTDSITNEGLVICGVPGGTLTLGSTNFTNTGTLLAGGGDFLLADCVSFTNQGSISVGGGSALQVVLWNYYSAPNAGPTPFSNGGTLRLQGGVFYENTGNGLFPAVALGNFAGGLIIGQGTVAAPLVNSGTIEASVANSLVVGGTITGAGTLLADPGCVLELAGAVASSQTFSFTGAGETLRLDMPGAFAAAVANYGAGDVLDLAGMPLLGLAISNGTLVATGTSNTFTLNSTALLGGALAGLPDGRGGTAITYTQQARGGLPAVIGASAPGGIFWASPVGDVFTGASANLNGARIGNWGITDALDITDMVPGQASLSWTQQQGQGFLTVSDGVHSAVITIFGTFTGSWFHLAADGTGGSLVTYHP